MLPVLLSLVNMQNNYCRTQATLFGLDSVSLMYISYCAGILCVLFCKTKFWLNIARCFAVLSIAAITARLFMPSAQAELACLLVCWTGLGGCVAYAIFLFVFLLNNTERLLGVLLVAFSHGVFMCLSGLDISGIFLTSLLPVLLALFVAACVFCMKSADTPVTKEQIKPLHPSIWLSTAFFTVLFILDSASSFVFANQNAATLFINGAGVFAAILLSVIIQIVYKQSVWHMWNLFFICSFLCHLLPAMSNSETVYGIASFLHGLLYVGYIAIFYTIAGIYKKHGSVALIKKNLFIMFSILALALTGLGFLESAMPQAVSVFIITGSAALFFVFVLLSPLFQRHFFAADWAGDFHKADMTQTAEAVEETDRFMNLGLTPREKEIAAFLLTGEPAKNIASALNISQSTVAFHSKNLYRKLNIQSRAELFNLFLLPMPETAGEEKYASCKMIDKT